jgi:hypothetical protein
LSGWPRKLGKKKTKIQVKKKKKFKNEKSLIKKNGVKENVSIFEFNPNGLLDPQL